MPTLVSNSFIAITGITGYIGSHVGLQALQAGYRVRGAVRSLARSKSLKEAYEREGIPASELEKRLEFVVIDDFSSQEQWTKAIKGVDGIVHIALPVDDIQNKKIISEAIEGTLSLLRAAKDEPSVKRFVVTSSQVAVYSIGTLRDTPMTDKDWNNEVVRIVESGEKVALTRGTFWNTYSAAKTKSEKAAWDFMEKEKPKFELVTILPSTNFGPNLHGNAQSTASLLESALKGGDVSSDAPLELWYVDVRDTARLHLLGLSTPSMAGKRFWAAAKPSGWNEVYAILRKHFPKLPIPQDFEGGGEDKQKIDNNPSMEILGGWIPLEKSVIDTAKSLGY